MGNRLENSLSIIRGTLCIPLEGIPVRDRSAVDPFGCLRVLSSVSGPWSGAWDRMCFMLNTAFCSLPFVKRYCPSPSFPSLGHRHAVLISVECVGFCLWAFAGLPSPGYSFPLGSNDFRWALPWESSYFPPGIKATGSEHSVMTPGFR